MRTKTRFVSSGMLRWSVFILAGAAVAGGALESWASSPVGIYAIVDKVVLEPDETAPERIQVWGAFTWKIGFGDQYSAPQHGYMYFKMIPGREQATRAEWQDLQKIAGTGEAIAFGSLSWNKLHSDGGAAGVRSAVDKPESPDEYPIAMGMMRLKEGPYSATGEVGARIVARLRESPDRGPSYLFLAAVLVATSVLAVFVLRNRRVRKAGAHGLGPSAPMGRV